MVVRLAACGWVAVLAWLLPGAAAAQHIMITGSRALAGPNYYVIGPDLGKRVGGNLFDSFVSFGLAVGQNATFYACDSLPQDPKVTLPALYVAGRDIAIGPWPVAPRAEVGGVPGAPLRCGF